MEDKFDEGPRNYNDESSVVEFEDQDEDEEKEGKTDVDMDSSNDDDEAHQVFEEQHQETYAHSIP